MITIRFACGHGMTVAAGDLDVPICHCGEHRVSRVTAPAPTFIGACSGPSADTRVVDPVPVTIPKEKHV